MSSGTKEQQKIYRADIKLRLCNSTLKNREEVLEQEGFPFQKDAWFDFCDKVDQVLPSLLFLNSISLLLGTSANILFLIGIFLGKNPYLLMFNGISIFVFLCIFWGNEHNTKLTTKHLRKTVMDISDDVLLRLNKQEQGEKSKNNKNATIALEVEMDKRVCFCLSVDMYAILVITTTTDSHPFPV